MSKMVSKFALAAGVALAMAFTVSCFPDGGSESIGTCGGKEYDPTLYSCERNEIVGYCMGQAYYPEHQHCGSNGEVEGGAAISSSSGGSTCSVNFRTVTIGAQVWAAENLNCDVAGSVCYDNDPANCAKYGRLYDWQTAQTVCPSGWHLPSDAEWTTLTDYVGNNAGTKLKATSGWDWNDYDNISGNGTDDYGFSALPGGDGSSEGIFLSAGLSGYWWSADLSDGAHDRFMDSYYEGVGWVGSDKSGLFSVRCVQGDPSSSSWGGRSSSSAEVYRPSSASKDTEIVQSFSLTLGEPFGTYLENLTIDVQFIGNPNNEELNPANGGKGLDSVRIILNNQENIHIWKSTESNKQLNFSYNETFNIEPVDKYCGREYPICVEVYALGKRVALGEDCKTFNRDVSRCATLGPPSYSSSSSTLPSSSSVYNILYGTPVTYGGETYQTVVIGTQTWFAKNLNYNEKGSVCYDNEQSNCAKYGRLYDWSTAMAICPNGWHLPSNADWDKLLRFADGTSGTESPYDSPTAGKYLKATSGWNWNDYENISGNGTDAHGFSALPGGGGFSDGSFYIVGYDGDWWSASEYNSDNAYYRYMGYHDEGAYWGDIGKSYLSSVRCLQD